MSWHLLIVGLITNKIARSLNKGFADKKIDVVVFS